MPPTSKKVKTAVIPAGGYGTRFLPATKSIPKEMFPLGDRPVVLHVVEEAVASGIENIIFVVSHHKQSVEGFFSSNEVLEEFFIRQGKMTQVGELQHIAHLAHFSFVFTTAPYGNGGALFPARHLIGNEPFVVVWADELIVAPRKPRIKQCIETYEKFGKPVISAIEITDPAKRHRYGMAELKNFPKGGSTVKEIVRIVEKPSPGEEPSAYATHGAYVLPPAIFDVLEETLPGKNGELWLTDVINNMKPQTGLLAKIIEGAEYFDCGDPLEYLFSQLDYALRFSPDADKVRAFIGERAQKNPPVARRRK